MSPGWPLASLDVIVVGCGVAGLSAAVAAAEAGAKVAVLERSRFEERGGNTRYTTAAIRTKSEEAVADDYEQRFTDDSGLAETFHEDSMPRIGTTVGGQ